MIFTCPTCCDITAPENAVRTNPIPGLKKDRRKNSIAARKKKIFDFYTSPGDLFLNTRLDRSLRGKKPPNTAGDQVLFRRRNTRKIDALVTIDHLFWPNERRKAAFSLPTWLPNPTFLAANCGRPGPEGGGGGSARRTQAKVLDR
jgi:hypothetical protein